VLSRLPPAAVRQSVELPLRLDGPDGLPGRDGGTIGRVFTFDGLLDGHEHVAIGLGACAVGSDGPRPLVRLHSECLTGDVLGSQRCDCGPQLHEAVRRIEEAGGYLLYLRQEGRGIGLYNKIDAYALQDDGLDTYEANVALGFAEDERTYSVAAQMLLALGVDSVDLLTNNPDKVAQLDAAGVCVDQVVPTGLHLSPVNGRYLTTKAGGGHRLSGLSRGRPLEEQPAHPSAASRNPRFPALESAECD
jgi:GTP cyclohydrolase II